MRMLRVAAVATAAAVAGAALAAAGPSWMWRGDGTGCFPGATPPAEWAPDKNVIWKTPLPDWSNASPIIVGDRIFVCYETSGLACVSKKDGAVLWTKTNDLKDLLSAEEWQAYEKRVAEWKRLNGESNRVQKQIQDANNWLTLTTEEGRTRHTEGLKKQWDRQAEQAKRQGKTIDPFKAPDYGPLPTAEEIAAKNKEQQDLQAKKRDIDKNLRDCRDAAPTRVHDATGHSTPTPVSDGRHVYALFASGVVVCYDLEGSRKWGAHVGPSSDGYGQAASPVLVGDRLLVPVDGIRAFDKTTGKRLWETAAPPKYGTPIPVALGDRQVVVTASGEVVAVADGQVVAKGLGALEYAAPLVRESVAYFIQGKTVAVSIPGEPGTSVKPLWAGKLKEDRYYASSVLYDGLIYAILQTGHASAVDAADGKVVWEQNLDVRPSDKVTVYPSVAAAGGLIFFSGDGGRTAVVKAGRTFELVRVNELEPFRSSPVFEGDRLYIRGLKHLWCIGKP